MSIEFVGDRISKLEREIFALLDSRLQANNVRVEKVRRACEEYDFTVTLLSPNQFRKTVTLTGVAVLAIITVNEKLLDKTVHDLSLLFFASAS